MITDLRRRMTMLAVQAEEDMGDTFCVESIDDNNVITFGSNTWLGSLVSSKKANVYLQVKKEKTSLTNVSSITLNAGDKLYFINDDTYITKTSANTSPLFNTSGRFNLAGDLCKFLWGTYNSVRNYACNYMFSNTQVVDASKLVLKVSHIFTPHALIGTGNYVFGYMFNNCTMLEYPPQLPEVAKLGSYSHQYMFYNCLSLKYAPELPSTLINNRCYLYMFYNCKSLTAAPALPATKLLVGCYLGMFRNCESLVKTPELPATTLADGCYYEMFFGCSSLITAPELPAKTLSDSCYAYAFAGCTLLSKSPILPATKYVTSAYSYIFYGCTNMSTITCLLENLDGNSTFTYWVKGVADFGVFYKSPNVTMEEIQSTGTLFLPNDWEVKDYEG